MNNFSNVDLETTVQVSTWKGFGFDVFIQPHTNSYTSVLYLILPFLFVDLFFFYFTRFNILSKNGVSVFSSMSGAAGSLSSMTSSCLQQARDHHPHPHASYHPYMFADSLHSLSSNYPHATRVNPAMAHSQPPTTAHHPANYTSSPVSSVPTQATGPGKKNIHFTFIFCKVMFSFVFWETKTSTERKHEKK